MFHGQHDSRLKTRRSLMNSIVRALRTYGQYWKRKAGKIEECALEWTRLNLYAKQLERGVYQSVVWTYGIRTDLWITTEGNAGRVKRRTRFSKQIVDGVGKNSNKYLNGHGVWWSEKRPPESLNQSMDCKKNKTKRNAITCPSPIA